jgi:serine/threonine-protein kinase HipA
MMQELIALLGNVEVGRILRAQTGKLTFRYDDNWRALATAYPLSLSMPLAAPEHKHELINSFLWGLLPDNEKILEDWAKKYHVSARNAFGLISHVGEDCAGAVQFVRPERHEEMKRESTAAEVEWLSEEDIAQRLRNLRRDHSAWRTPADTGQFSLAGAQPKTALLLENGRWGIPSGRMPTTHIVKPPTGEWDGHAENEHFCLELASRLGMAAARTTVRQFAGEVAIVIERYDRLPVAQSILRVHQEDLCQALGLPPTSKYQSDGGPGVREIVDVLRNFSDRPQEDINGFLDAIAFNWLIAGTDAHAKNYSVLIGSSSTVRLAPLYDVASILPYEGIVPQKIRLAMKLGGTYRLRDIGIHQWRKLAAELRVNKEQLISRVQDLAAAMPTQISLVEEQTKTGGLLHPLISRLSEKLRERATHCQGLLQL